MTAYTVHRIRGTAQRVVVLQYPGLDTGPIRMAAPLYPSETGLVLEGVTPLVEIDGESLLQAVHLMAAVRLKELGPAEANLDAHEYPIANAINRLFFGV